MRSEVFTLHLESENSLSFEVRVLDGRIQPQGRYKIRAVLLSDSPQSQSLLAEGESFYTRHRSTQMSREADLPTGCLLYWKHVMMLLKG